MKRHLSSLLLLALFSGNVDAAIFTVGNGGACSHGTIQAALNAAAASPGADTVRLTRSLTYEPEANTINDSANLNLVGGFATCNQVATDNIKTTVSGFGGAAEPVLRIYAGTGVVIKLRHLTITEGDEDGEGGGGIYFQGDGALELIETTVSNNQAPSGGGIYAFATGTNAELVISASTLISNNTALYNGGGIWIGGPIEMTMTAPNSIIAFNDALGQSSGTGYGGGLLVTDRARAYIGTSGAFGLGAIYSNTAIDGGGISIHSGGADGADAWVYLFTTDPQLPVSVRDNYASDTGGAVYLQSYAGPLAEAHGRLCAWDFRVEDNAARDGSALYLNSDSFLDFDSGSQVKLNDPSCTHPQAVRCASTVACNTISGNDAVETGGGFSDGATLRLLARSDLVAFRFSMRGNRGGDGIRADGGNFVSVDLEDCLLAENEFSRQLLRTEGDEYVYATVEGCTIANNVINSTDVMHIEGSLELHDTIIDQPGNLTVAHSGPAEDLDVTNVLASDITTLPADPSIISGDPSFVDAVNGDYHLSSYSLAIDFAPPVTGDDRDLDNQPRDQNLPGVPDLFGVRDLGAYERQVGPLDCGAADTIFCNGFDP